MRETRLSGLMRGVGIHPYSTVVSSWLSIMLSKEE